MKRVSTATTSEERARRLGDVIARLQQRYGAHIIRLGAEFVAVATGAWPGCTLPSTGSFSLDLLTGGLPQGAITEIAGVDGAGKGTLALAALAACQQEGGAALLVDADAAADPESLEEAGVDLSRLLLACPTTIAEAWDILISLCRCGALHLLVLTSLPGLLHLPGAHAPQYRLQRGVTRLQGALRGRETALLLTNLPVPGAPHATVGGASLAQAAALRIALEHDGLVYGPHGDVTALRAIAHVVKYHGMARGPALPLEIAPQGPRRAAEMVALGRTLGCIAVSPLGLVAEGRLLGRTPGRAAAAMESDPDLAATLEQQVRVAWADHHSTWGAGGAAR